MLPRNAVIRRITAGALLALALAAAAGLVAQDGATPYLGVTIAPDDAGARVLMVAPGSPADAAGLQADDVITAVNKAEVSANSLAQAIQGYAVGDTVTLSVIRGGETLELAATLAQRPAAPSAPPTRVIPRQAQPRAFLGVTLEQSAGGVTIAEVVATRRQPKLACKLAGDIIAAVNGQAARRPADVVNVVRAAQPGDGLALTIERGGETLEIEAVLGQTEGVVPGVGPMPGPRPGADLAIYLEPAGVWHIVSLNQDSALYAAGLRVGDVVSAVDGAARTPEALDQYLSGLEADAEVALTVERNGETLNVSVPAGALAELNWTGLMGRMPFFDDGLGRRGGRIVPDMPMMRSGPRLGVAFQTLNAEIAAEKGLNVTEGALIVEVAPNSPAERAGLRAGDVVTAVDGDPVDARRTLAARLLPYEPGDTVVLTVLRAGETLKLEVILGQFERRGLRPPFFGGRGPDEGGRSFRFMIPPAGRGFRFGLPVPPAPEAPQATPQAGANV
ncbi:MAG: PDZ domain-containing protein [Aggregatilineales bacterium]